ncbi:MAG: hypothetical protein ACKPKO_33790, partial [Candidatus Fonsibacter sp.]
GLLSGKGSPTLFDGSLGDFYIDLDTFKIYGPKSFECIWGNGTSLIGATGPKGDTGDQGPQGVPGITTLGYYGSFYDTTDFTIPTVTPAPIPLNTTDLSSGVTLDTD